MAKDTRSNFYYVMKLEQPGISTSTRYQVPEIQNAGVSAINSFSGWLSVGACFFKQFFAGIEETQDG